MNEQSLTIFPYVFCRSCGLLAVLPLLELERNWAGRLLLAGIFSLSLCLTCKVDLTQAAEMGALQLVAEAGLGALIGLPVAFFVSAAVLAGELIDAGRGQTIAQVYDPFSGAQSSLLATVFGQYSFAFVLAAGGGTTLYQVLANSLAELMPGQVAQLAISDLAYRTFIQAAELLIKGMHFVLPLLFVLATIEFLIGWVPKLVPGMQLQTESFMLKTLVSGVFLLNCL